MTGCLTKAFNRRKMAITGFFRAIIIVFFLHPGVLIAHGKNDLQREKLKGVVKSVTEYEYAAAEDSKTPEKGALRSKAVCKYNADGNRAEYITYSPEGTVLSRSVYNYNDSGRLTDVKRYRGDGGLNVTTVYEYDKAGNEVGESNTDASGTLFMTSKSKYDLNGNRIVYDRYDGTGHLFLKSNVRFDKNGNPLEEREYDSHSSLQFTTTYEYDDYDKSGNWLQKVMYKNKKPRSLYEREIEY